MTPRVSCALGALVVFLAVPLFLGWSARRAATDALRRHAEDVERLEAEFRSRGRNRPGLFDPLPDDAPEAWVEVWARLCNSPFGRTLDDMSLGVDPDPETVDALERDLEPILALFRDTLRRFPRFKRPANGAGPPFDLIPERLLGLAGHFGRTGRSAEAFDLLLLVLAFAQDEAWTWSGFHILREREAMARVVAGRILEEHTLTAEQIAGILSRLDRLEASRPTVLDELALEERWERAFILGLVNEGHPTYQQFRPPVSWKTWGSEDIARAAALGEVEDRYRLLRRNAARAGPDRPWAPLRAALAAALPDEAIR